jgi:hypothetical protein
MKPDRAKVYAESVAMTNAALPTTVPVGRVAISLAAAPPRCAPSLLAVFALVGTYRARYGSPDAWPGNPSAGDNAAEHGRAPQRVVHSIVRGIERPIPDGLATPA